MVNLTGPPATINIQVDSINIPITRPLFTFHIGPPIFVPTLVDIDNYLVPGVGNAQLTIDGRVYNPIGTTVVRNQHGDILAGPDSPSLVSNALRIIAERGTIGTRGIGQRTPIAVVLVQSDYLVDNIDPTRLVSLVAEAAGDVVLDITSILRGSETTFTPTLGPIHAGGTIDLLINDSLHGNDTPTFTANGSRSTSTTRRT